MRQVIQVVNFIKSRPLQSRLFAQLCDAMDSDYKSLLYHTEVRWLSKGKVLNRLVRLKVEVTSFLENPPVFPRISVGAKCTGHVRMMCSAVCSTAPHSQFDVGARPHLCMND